VNWTDFLLGGMSFMIAYAFLSMGLETENELEEAPPEQQIDNVVSSDFSSKPVKMYCQDCRKVKKSS
jgi:hypothetical protein